MRYLLVNPPVYDFAAYDYWLKPLGILYISAILKKFGHKVDLINCMDRSRPESSPGADRYYGRGKFESEYVMPPNILKKYKRKYSIYGIHGEKLNKILKEVPVPEKIFLSSAMTYWYPGVREAALKLKKQFPKSELILGGTYPTLMKEHAALHIPADRIVSGDTVARLSDITGENIPEFEDWPAPDYSGYNAPGYIVIRTSQGCPYSCAYCGIKNIHKGFRKKTAKTISGEIKLLYSKYKLRDFVFYDDALLKNREFKDIFNSLPEELRFHTPNGLEIEEITAETADILKRANFIEPCLAADVIGRRNKSNQSKKLNKAKIKEAAENLFSAGYRSGNLYAYLIVGLPGQKLAEVRKSAEYLHETSLKVKLAEYALVPGSEDAKYFSKAVNNEPLLHNNSIFPSYDISQWEDIFKLKRYVSGLNGNF